MVNVAASPLCDLKQFHRAHSYEWRLMATLALLVIIQSINHCAFSALKVPVVQVELKRSSNYRKFLWFGYSERREFLVLLSVLWV